MDTRTVLLWRNTSAEGIYFTVNPPELPPHGSAWRIRWILWRSRSCGWEPGKPECGETLNSSGGQLVSLRPGKQPGKGSAVQRLFRPREGYRFSIPWLWQWGMGKSLSVTAKTGLWPFMAGSRRCWRGFSSLFFPKVRKKEVAAASLRLEAVNAGAFTAVFRSCCDQKGGRAMRAAVPLYTVQSAGCSKELTAPSAPTSFMRSLPRQRRFQSEDERKRAASADGRLSRSNGGDHKRRHSVGDSGQERRTSGRKYEDKDQSPVLSHRAPQTVKDRRLSLLENRRSFVEI